MSKVTATAWGLIKKWDKQQTGREIKNGELPKPKCIKSEVIFR